MKSKIIIISFLFIAINSFAATYTSSGDGTWGPGRGLPNSGYWGGATDIVYIDHAITFGSNFTFGGAKGYTLVIRNGGSLTITGKFTSNNGTITIDEGGILAASNGLYANNNSGIFTINGDMNITGGDVSGVANEWIIGSTGNLNVAGDLNNDNSSMDMTVYGTVNVTGDANFHSGSYVIEPGGTFTGEGSDLQVGNANLVNNGTMSFPNVTDVEEWSGSFDCDGSGTGIVDFGQNISCNSVCSGSTGSGTAGCYSNGSAPLPIELLYFNVKEEGASILFNWATLTEIQNDFFTIEYSYDAVNFIELVESVAGAGDSHEVIDYEISYPSFFNKEIIYFRLKQTDYDGTNSLSDIKSLLLSETSLGVFVYPNPASAFVSIQIEDKENLHKASLVNPMGINDIHEFVIENGTAELDLSDFQEGVYFFTY